MHDLYAQAYAIRNQSQLLAELLQATKQKNIESWQLIRDSWDETERIQARRLAASTDPDRLRYSAYARLQAQLASLPVIEQAKGIIMAKYGWPADQAFDALRRASQQKNIKVRDLAASIVAQTAGFAPAQRQAGPASAPARSAEPISRGSSGGSRNRHRASA